VLPIDQIEIGDDRRECDPARIAEITASIKRLGLRTPITVRRRESEDMRPPQWELVAGLHRLQAANALGHPTIACTIISGSKTEARRWQIAENLHRAELTALQRAQQVKEWIDLTHHDEISGQNGKKRKRGRPEGGISKAARELQIPGRTEEARRKVVSRAIEIAGISQEAKSAASESGLADNQAALLEIAEKTELQAQLEKVSEIARRQQSTGRKHTRAQKKSDAKRCSSEESMSKADDLDIPPFLDRRLEPKQIADSEELSQLKIAWDGADALREAWKRASESARDRFIAEVLRRRQPQAPEAVQHADE
jgi:ParB family chromosome partitioning protein